MTLYLAPPDTARAEDTYAVIFDDRGGEVIDYLARARKIKDDGTLIVIIGRCQSACTAYLSSACVDGDNAKIGFHGVRWASGHSGRTMEEIYRKEVIRQFFQKKLVERYPPRVQAWIEAKGGVPTDGSWLWLVGNEARGVIGSCYLRTLPRPRP